MWSSQEELPTSSKGSEKGKGKGDGKFGPLGRKPPPAAGNVPPTTRKPQVVPARGTPGAGVGSPPAPETQLVKALQLLQSFLSPKTSPSMRRNWRLRSNKNVSSFVKESFLRRGRPIVRSRRRSILNCLRSMSTIWRSKGRCLKLFGRNWPKCETR